jgi:hypothetical protein
MHRVKRGMSENDVKIVNKRVDRVAKDDLTCHMRHTTLPSSSSLPTFTLFDLLFLGGLSLKRRRKNGAFETKLPTCKFFKIKKWRVLPGWVEDMNNFLICE